MARQDRQRRDDSQRDDGDGLFDKLVGINRVAKVVKGGRRFGFAALVVVGDQKGRVGFGSGKAREVPEAIRKATEAAKRNLIRVPLREGRTLHHDIEGRFGAGHVICRSAPAGTGIIAGGPMRAVFETLGVQDVVAKSIGSSNPHNMIKATFSALQHIQAPRVVAAKRGKRIGDILGSRKQAEAAEAEAQAEEAAAKAQSEAAAKAKAEARAREDARNKAEADAETRAEAAAKAPKPTLAEKQAAETRAKVEVETKPRSRSRAQPAAKPAARPADARPGDEAAAKPEAKPGDEAAAKPEAKPETGPEQPGAPDTAAAKPETKPEAKPEAKPETGPDTPDAPDTTADKADG